MSFSLGLIDWVICLVVSSSSILFGLYLAVRKKSPADSSHFFWPAAVCPGLWWARHCLPPRSGPSIGWDSQLMATDMAFPPERSTLPPAGVWVFALPGVIALALFPGSDSRTTFVSPLNELLPTGMRGLLLASLFASPIASPLSVMNSVCTLAVRDFVLHFRPRNSERSQVLLGRLAIGVATFLGVMAAYVWDHINMYFIDY